MNFKNVLQRVSVMAFSGVMALNCLTPAVYAWSDADETEYYNKHIENVISWNRKTFEHSGIGPDFKKFPDNPLTYKVREYTKDKFGVPRYRLVSPARTEHKVHQPVKKPVKVPLFRRVFPPHTELKMYQTITEPAITPSLRRIPRTLPESDYRPVNLLDAPAENYLLWKHEFYGRKEDVGKDILPDTSGLTLSDGTQAKLNEFIKDGLGYMPKDIRSDIVADFDKVFKEAPEGERDKVLDSFMSIALSTKSLLYEAASKEDYLRLAYNRYSLSHIHMGPSSINVWSKFKKCIEDDFHAVDKYTQKYTSMLNDHKEEIVQRYKDCGSPISETLRRLSFKKSIYAFNSCYLMGENHIPLEACRRTIEENTKDLDPLLRDEIRKDFDTIWACEDCLENTKPSDSSLLSRGSEKRDLNLTRLDRTFALCQSIFALKRDLYRAVEKASRA